MLSGSSLASPDFSGPRWPFYVLAAYCFAALVVSFGPWFQRRRTEGWPVAEGRIESVDVTEGKPSWYSTGIGSPVIAELGYSYSVVGSAKSGRYRRDFPTEQEAREFVRDLKGKPVAVCYDPRKPCKSRLSEHAIETLLQNRPPALPGESEDVFPGWAKPLLWIFIAISTVGLVLSLCVHLGAMMGARLAPPAFFIIPGGLFIVWPAVVFAGWRVAGSVDRKYYWKLVLGNAPDWMRYMASGFFGYAIVNFLLFIARAPHGGGGPDFPPIVWRGFSGHWMAFYSVALVTLYSAVHARRDGWRCINGHFVPMSGRWCERCGQPVTEGRRGSKDGRIVVEDK